MFDRDYRIAFAAILSLFVCLYVCLFVRASLQNQDVELRQSL